MDATRQRFQRWNDGPNLTTSAFQPGATSAFSTRSHFGVSFRSHFGVFNPESLRRFQSRPLRAFSNRATKWARPSCQGGRGGRPIASDNKHFIFEFRGRGAGRDSEFILTVSTNDGSQHASLSASRVKVSKVAPSPALTT